jgi:hypothetical protein
MRYWGRNEDGTLYVVGMTVSELRKELDRFADTDEVCITVCRKKKWNGGGLFGKLKAIEQGNMATEKCKGQIWLKALVLDPSLE